MESASTRGLTAAIAAVAIFGGVGATGWILSHPTSAVLPTPPPEPAAPAEPHFDTKVARGEYLFNRTGCPACHGPDGRGGVPNANYIRDTIPALTLTAGRLRVFQKSDADKLVALLEHGDDPHAAAASPPFDQYGVFLAQWDATRTLIQTGNPAGKKDPNGPAPPLNMPAWRGTLNDEDMTCILAWLVTKEPWDADGYAPEETEVPEVEALEHAAGVVEPNDVHPPTPGAPAAPPAAP